MPLARIFDVDAVISAAATMFSTSNAVPRLRQLEERQVETSVCLLEWSPKMDILAVAMENGDVQLYRLNWQKVS